MNEHIGRLSQIGLAKESVSGTPISAATVWMPRTGGDYMPKFDIKFNPATYGVIDENKQGQLMRTWAELTLEGDPGDQGFPNILNALLGTEYPCVKFPIPGSITGTYTVGEVITESTSKAKGTLRRSDVGGSAKALYVQPTTVGTFTVTIASPGVFSLTGHGFSSGDGVSFTTTGALPTGIVANTNYFVIAAGLTADAFEISATSGGSAINTSGSQSGVHTAYRGIFSGGLTLTGGFSGATATGGSIEAQTAVRWHVFQTLQSNTPVSYTIFHHDPVVADEYSAYGVIDTLDLEVVSNDWAKYTSKWIAKALTSASAQTPSYPTENYFYGKSATVKLASAFTGLDAASAVAVERIKLSFNKNVEVFQAVGSTALTSIHNKQFSVKGEMVLLWNATTYRDYLTNSTDRALRVTLASAATLGSGSNPTIQFDFPDVFFTTFATNTDLNGLVRQTLGFTATYDLTTTQSLSALVANNSIAAL